MKYLSFLFFLSVTFSLDAQDFGLASYYADSFQGLTTASGDLYDKNKMTAAHKTLPFGTMVRVTRLDNKKSVVVKINDRGPFIKGRVIDLSRRAAEQLDIISAGEARVKLDVLSGSNKNNTVAKTTNTKKSTPPKTTNSKPAAKTVANATKRPDSYNDSSEPRKVATKTVQTPVTTKSTTTAKGVEKEEEAATPTIAEAKMLRSGYNQYGLYKIKLLRPEKKGFGVQVASYSSYDNVMKRIADLQAKWFDDILVNIEPAADNGTNYKVILGQFPTQAAAANYKKNLQRKHGIKGFVVELTDI